LLNRQPCKNERKSYTNCAGFELLRAWYIQKNACY
jgi:hypothetical protein